MIYHERLVFITSLKLGTDRINIILNSRGLNYPGDLLMPPSRNLVSVFRVGRRPLAIKFGNGHLGKLGYDAKKRIVSIDWIRASDGKSISRERNLYGRIGEWRMHQLESTSRIFEYDEIGRLIEAVDYKGIPLLDLAAIYPPAIEEGLAIARIKYMSTR